MNRDTLITGGTGLVGSAINVSTKISSKDVDLTDRNSTIDLFKKISPEKVIHCAGKVGGLKANSDKLGEFFYHNIIINFWFVYMS